MATLLDDLDLHYDPDLYLPIRGTVYRIEAPPIHEADRVRELVWTKNLDPRTEHAEIVKILGGIGKDGKPRTDGAYAQMAANEVPAPFVSHAGRTAIIHFGASPELGRAHWTFAYLTERINIDELIDNLAESAPKVAADAAKIAAEAKA